MSAAGPSGRKRCASRPPFRPDSVPASAVRRLSLYLRELEGLVKQNRQTISSKELGQTLGYTDAQVRRDLAYFGQFGQPGIGYAVSELIAHIRGILGTDRTWNVVVVGAGHLGQALLTYSGFARRGFRIVAIFDNDPMKIGQHIGSVPEMEILDVGAMPRIVAERRAQIGIVAVPASAAQQVADSLLAAGVKGVLNFAPTLLSVPVGVPVASVELAQHLEQIAYKLKAGRLAAKG